MSWESGELLGDGLRKANGRSSFDFLKRRGVLLAAAGLHGMGWWDGGVRVATKRWLCDSCCSRAGHCSTAAAVDLMMLRVCSRERQPQDKIVPILCSIYLCFSSTTPKPPPCNRITLHPKNKTAIQYNKSTHQIRPFSHKINAKMR